MRKPYNAVIVDDERLARNRLKSLLAEHPEIQVVGEADSVQKALEVIKATKPDILFLDIQMPGESGFDLLDKIEVTSEVIFVTAFDEYAIRAFEVNALDYLLKPVHPERLANAIKRLSESESAAKVEKGKKEIRKLEYDDLKEPFDMSYRYFMKLRGKLK